MWGHGRRDVRWSRVKRLNFIFYEAIVLTFITPSSPVNSNTRSLWLNNGGMIQQVIFSLQWCDRRVNKRMFAKHLEILSFLRRNQLNENLFWASIQLAARVHNTPDMTRQRWTSIIAQHLSTMADEIAAKYLPLQVYYHHRPLIK